MQLPGMTASSGPTDRARIIRHGTDDLLLKELTVSDDRPLTLLRRETSDKKRWTAGHGNESSVICLLC